jgi:hypothetical protein
MAGVKDSLSGRQMLRSREGGRSVQSISSSMSVGVMNSGLPRDFRCSREGMRLGVRTEARATLSLDKAGGIGGAQIVEGR